MTEKEAREIIIKERDSLKANPRVKVEDCLYEAFDLSIKALEQLASEKEHKVGVTYICDGKKCPECSKLCRHTTDVSHAKNFKPVMFIDGKTVLDYEEVENGNN